MNSPYSSIVILTGAGISAESGVPVFRGDDGLWENHRIEDVATHAAYLKDPEGVNAFFNQLRAKLPSFQPNAAHKALSLLEQNFDGNFLLITQNIDDLHVRAGSQKVIPLHGELLRVACTSCQRTTFFDKNITQETTYPCCEKKGFLRPDIVLFNEMPKSMDIIEKALTHCDLFIAIGTSGFVYPAAGFVDIARQVGAHTIEMNLATTERSPAFEEHIQGPATHTVPALVNKLLPIISCG